MSQQALRAPPPPRMIEGGFIFFAWVSSATKFFPKKSGFCRRYSHWNAPKVVLRHNHLNPIFTKLASFNNNE